ncbi:MAG TPA: hypothetical protein VK590_04210 [Saprospiraceae bacterium]|nr:hypothetical protein [Saprospiraceae bacterium]
MMKTFSNLFILLFFGFTILFLTSCSKKEAIQVSSQERLTGTWQSPGYGYVVKFYSNPAAAFIGEDINDTLYQNWGNITLNDKSDGSVNMHVDYTSFSKDGGQSHYLSATSPVFENWVIKFNSDTSFTADIAFIVVGANFKRLH